MGNPSVDAVGTKPAVQQKKAPVTQPILGLDAIPENLRGLVQPQNLDLGYINKDLAKINVEKNIEAGTMTSKKSFLDGEYYELNVKKYNELTGENLTFGNIKEMFGLEDGIIQVYNNVSFKDAANGEDRSLDNAHINDKNITHDGNKDSIKFPKYAVGGKYKKQ